MKKNKVMAMLVLAGTVMSGLAFEGSAKTLNMTIDEDTVIKNTTRKMYGANFEWGGEEQFYLKAQSGTLENNPSFIECFKDALPFNRMAGTSANNFYWKKAIGPLSDRVAMYNWGWTKVNPHGPVEWIKGTQMADSTGEYVYTINLSDTPENAADLVEFLTCDGKENPNGGENWAKKRIEYGLPEPANIAIWELGNEMDLYGEDVWPVERYVKMAREKIQAVRSVDKDAKFSCHAHTYATNLKAGWENWHRTVLKELGDELDYVSMHYYYPSTDVASGGRAIDIINEDIKTITGSDRIKIIFSENACARAATSSDAGALFRRPHTLEGAMATAEFQARMMHRPEVVAANYHSINSASWQICYMDNSKVLSSSILELFRMLQNTMCGDVVKSSLDGFEINEISDTISAAVKTETGINVYIVNRSHTDSNTVNINSNKMYSLSGKHILTGKSPDSDNVPGKREIDREYTEYASAEPIFSYTAPPMSATVLCLTEIELSEEELLEAKYKNAKERVTLVANMSNKYVVGGDVKGGEYPGAMNFDGVFHIPSRMAADMFGYSVSWNEDATQITFTKGNNVLVYSENDENMSSKKKDGYTYVPVRSFAELNGKEVRWDERGIVMMADAKAVDFDKYMKLLGDELYTMLY